MLMRDSNTTAGVALAVVAKLPSGASVERTDEVLQKVARRVLPVAGVLGSVMLAGFDGPSQTLAPNSAAAYFPLKSFVERQTLRVKFDDISNEARKRPADITEAQIVIIPHPLTPDIGPPGGDQRILVD